MVAALTETCDGQGIAGEPWRDVFEQVRARPEEERWMTIPWQTDLWKARRLAREEGKPIFLWAMNGNPLGCT